MQALLAVMGKGKVAEALAHFTFRNVKRSLTKHDDRETMRLGGCYCQRHLNPSSQLMRVN